MNGYILLGLLVVLPASIEGREIHGDFRDSYDFIGGNGNHFIGTYSADNEGFYQEYNTPKPPTHSRAVQEERDNHFRRWEELAGFPNPGDDIYNRDLVRAEPKTQYYHVQPREWKYRPTTPKPPTHSRAVQAARDNHFRRWEELAGFPNPGSDIYNKDLVRADSEKQYYQVQPREWKYRPMEEERGGPRGFFYSFDYEVPLLRNVQEREELNRLRNTRSVTETPVAASATAQKKVEGGESVPVDAHASDDKQERYQNHGDLF